jgi:two-component system sensor histidine kinase DctS
MFDRPTKIQTKITLLSFVISSFAIMIGGIMLVENFSRMLERELGARALAIARTVAAMEEIQSNIGKPQGGKVIQPIAERIRLATNVAYIVIFDMEKTRYSHPLERYLGTKFTGNDEGPALANHEYLSRAEGVLGPSVRAFTPIMTDEGSRQVGVVVVGNLVPTLSKMLYHIRFQLYLSLITGLLVGAVGSLLLARNIKRKMFNLEPEEIARLLEERTAVFQSISDGIIAIDRYDRITIINDEAKRIIGVQKNITGLPITAIIADSRLPDIVRTGEAIYNQERILNNTTILASRIPIKVKGEIIGAVTTIKDKTEVSKLAEELTGVKKFIEALRVQNHEHMNKLHTIAGLIQLKKYSEALDYIFTVSEMENEITKFATHNFKDASIAGLILGKIGRARELKIALELDPQSRLHHLPAKLDNSALVIILGNLLENAMEAVSKEPAGKRKVYFSLKEQEDSLTITVTDTGKGIPTALTTEIFKPGFTTKNEPNRGYGLTLVQSYVELANGKLTLDSEEGSGTTINLYLPK